MALKIPAESPYPNGNAAQPTLKRNVLE
jgi:hypothetical protein